MSLRPVIAILIFFLILKIIFGVGKEVASAKKEDDLNPFYFQEPNGFLFEENFYLIGIESNNESLPFSEKLPAILTGYSSSPDETDDSPNITASGSEVVDGLCANNLLSLGTRVRFPEVFGDKVFVVKDRMSPAKSPFHFDIWFPDRESALNFGAKITEVEILK